MSSIYDVWCQGCKGPYDEICTLPCKDQFCGKCEEKMVDGKLIVCMICCKVFDKNKVKKKALLIPVVDDEVQSSSPRFFGDVVKKEQKNIHVKNENIICEKQDRIDKNISSCKKLSYAPNELKIKLDNKINSACVYKQNVYTVDDKSLKTYNIETGKYQTILDFAQIFKESVPKNVHILNNEINLFLHYNNDSSKYFIAKFNDNKRQFDRIKTLKGKCQITSTFKQTLLRVEDNMIIEISANGRERKRIPIPDTAILSSSDFYNTAYQLKDGQYFLTSYDSKSVQISLLDAQGFLTKFLSQPQNSPVKSCTDGEKLIFLLNKFSGKITVLSTSLQQLQQFSYPGVENMFYDQVNGKLLLVKENELIYFKHYFDMLSLI